MMEQENRTTLNTQPATALAPSSAPASPPPSKPAGWFTRETKLAAIVLLSFLAVAAGIYAVKVVFKPSQTSPPTEIAQRSPTELDPQLPPQLTRTTALEPSPVPEVKIPPMKAVDPDKRVIVPQLEPPPIMLPKDPAQTDVPIIVPMDPPLIPKDGFSSVKEQPAAKSELPRLDLPPINDPVPEAKNPVIRIGASEPKKDAPLKVDVPAIPDPPPAIDLPTKKEPPAVDLVPVIEPSPKKEPAKKDPPVLDPAPVLDPKSKKDPPVIDLPPSIDPPVKKELPADPKRAMDPPLIKNDVPVIDVPPPIDLPMPKKTPTHIDIDPKSSERGPAKADATSSRADYDEDLHPFKKEDTYRSISKQYYNSDTYAVALQRYNRDHPGQADYVRVPPIWVLEKKYAADIATASARSTSNAPPVGVDLNLRTDNVYTVSDNGEMLAEIARKMLGSEDAWKRIWDLNPQVNPAKVIPGGTRLRLPTGNP